VIAGEVEAALADAGIADSVGAVTDALAERVLGREVPVPVPVLRGAGSVTRSAPEGFAYYGLHPAAFARIEAPADALVVGIRSIGTTLSAVVRAALGPAARRVTVRPSGPPFDRVLAEAPDAEGRPVVVVDEGPGLSGSTILAVAEAFVRQGTPRERILVACTSLPDPARLRARDAAARWRYRTWVAPSRTREPEGRDLSGGAWRDMQALPTIAFPPFERRKVLVGDRLWKLEGLGSAARAARARGEVLAAAGFALPSRDEGDGWTSTAWHARGTPPDLDRLAAYCAFRAQAFSSSAPTNLEPVVAKNARAFGLAPPRLVVARPTVCDARMEPHEWVDGFKTDATSHGDDHFFPGPTDVAWDLAGAIVGFRLDPAPLLERYRALSGDDARARIRDWIRAFAIQRAAFIAFVEAIAPDATLAHERARLLAIAGGASVDHP